MNNRRTFIKSLGLTAGTYFLSPIVNSIRADALGINKPRPRFVFILQGNGCEPIHLNPGSLKFTKREGRRQFRGTDLADHKLPNGLFPMEKHKDLVTIIQGLSGRVTKGGHSTNHGALGAFYSPHGRPKNMVKDHTIDYLLGSNSPGIVPWLGVGLTKNKVNFTYNVSAKGPGKPLAIITNPEIAYKAYFGVVGDDNTRQEFSMKKNLLDFMKDDIKQVRKKLAKVDHEKLDTYLESYEELNLRQSRLVEIRNTLSQVSPSFDSKFTSGVETDIVDSQFEIATAALIGGVTNVATIASSVGKFEPDIVYKGLKIPCTNHQFGHREPGKKNTRIYYDRVRSFHFGLIARMVDKFKSIPEGNGTMMDNTIIVYMSDAPEAHHSKGYEWPMVVIGNYNKRLKNSGRYLEYPNYGLKGHRTTANLFNTLLHITGKEINNFGYRDEVLGDGVDQFGPLSELMS